MLKKLIGIVLLIIVSVQIFPIGTAKDALFNDLVIENTLLDGDFEKKEIEKEGFEKEYIPYHFLCINANGFINSKGGYTIKNVGFIPNRAIEVLCPPPNC